jgi:hypothetical protein
LNFAVVSADGIECVRCIRERRMNRRHPAFRIAQR